MAGTRTRSLRGLVVLALAGGLTAGALLAPAGAASFATKRFVKKQVNKAVNKLSSNVIHQPVYYRQSASVPLAADSFDEAFVACPAGTSPLGGGVSPGLDATPPVDFYADVNIEASHPASAVFQAGTTGWAVSVEEEASVPTSFRAYVICAAVQKDSNFAEGSPPGRVTVGTDDRS